MPEFLRSPYHFVDEAGTPIIWGRRQRDVVIGRNDSRYFIIGLADIRDVTTVSNGVDHLRRLLMKSSDLAGIPSLQPEKRKTAQQFHAKDDHPIVRDRLFELLCQPYIRFYAVVRDKRAVLESIQRTQTIDSSYRYHPNNLYDAMVRRLFSGRLHFNDSRYTVYFAQRDKSDRQAALLAAIKNAQKDYEAHAGSAAKEPAIRFFSAYPQQFQGLQIVDYFCWALQRLYERNDNTYWKRLWDAGKVRCVIALDDTFRNSGGEIYSRTNPLTGELRWPDPNTVAQRK